MRRRKLRPRRMQLRKIPPNANPTACSRARRSSKNAWRSLPTSVRRRKQMSVRRSVVVSKGGRLLGQPTDRPRAATEKAGGLMSAQTSAARDRQLQAGRRAYEAFRSGKRSGYRQIRAGRRPAERSRDPSARCAAVAAGRPSIFSASPLAAGKRLPQPEKSRAKTSSDTIVVAMCRNESLARFAARERAARLKIRVSSRSRSMMSRASDSHSMSGRPT